MANRTKSDPTPQHETMPGPGPAKLGDEGGSGVHPVEQMVDAAIDRLAREHQASRDNQQRHGLALRNPSAHGSGRLRWKGLDVSDEFRRYAERVAQGEDLPPYEGRILAEPNAKFPWEPSERKRASRKAVRLQMLLWGGAAMGVGLLSWSLATRLGDTPTPLSTAAGAPAPLSNRAIDGRVGGSAATSEAVLSIHGAPGRAGHIPEPVSGAAPAPETSREANTLSALPQPSAAPPAPQLAPAPSARPSARVAPPASHRELEPIPYPDVAPPGAIREALGALLAARAEPGEFSAASSAGDPAAVSNPAPAESRPAPSSAPPVVRKETEGQSSASESLLVETPSF